MNSTDILKQVRPMSKGPCGDKRPPTRSAKGILLLRLLPTECKEGRNSRGRRNSLPLCGTVSWACGILAAHPRKAGIVAAKNIAGVKVVHSHVPWVDPVSGMVSDDDHDGHASVPTLTLVVPWRPFRG